MCVCDSEPESESSLYLIHGVMKMFYINLYDFRAASNGQGAQPLRQLPGVWCSFPEQSVTLTQLREMLTVAIPTEFEFALSPADHPVDKAPQKLPRFQEYMSVHVVNNATTIFGSPMYIFVDAPDAPEGPVAPTSASPTSSSAPSASSSASSPSSAWSSTLSSSSSSSSQTLSTNQSPSRSSAQATASALSAVRRSGQLGEAWLNISGGLEQSPADTLAFLANDSKLLEVAAMLVSASRGLQQTGGATPSSSAEDLRYWSYLHSRLFFGGSAFIFYFPLVLMDWQMLAVLGWWLKN